jgi:NitT/TauT family transport system permease protein
MMTEAVLAHIATSARRTPGLARRVLASPVLAQAAILVLLLAAWEAAVKFDYASGFLFGWPSGIASTGWRLILSGELVEHAAYTLGASTLGFVIGTLAGSAIGLGLWYSSYLAKVLEPFLVAINSVPKIAFAPLVILWFGTGLTSKVALSISLTAIVALLAAFQSAREADPDLQRMMASLGCTKRQIFMKVVIPSSMPHIIGTFHINIGFALVGTVVGEFISSRYGIGHVIFVASSLYDLNTVWVGIVSLMVMGFLLSLLTNWLDHRLLSWKERTFAPSFGA